MPSAVIRSEHGYPAFTPGGITGSLAVRPSRSSRTRDSSSQIPCADVYKRQVRRRQRNYCSRKARWHAKPYPPCNIFSFIKTFNILYLKTTIMSTISKLQQYNSILSSPGNILKRACQSGFYGIVYTRFHYYINGYNIFKQIPGRNLK